MRFHFRHLVTLIGAFVLLTMSDTNAQPSPSTTTPDRYLFVLNTSATMRLRAAAVQEAITAMLVSGMRGELKDGDEIGIWTFDEELHTGEFPLISWKASDSNELTRQILQFVQSRRYANQTRFENVRSDLLDVAENSRRITIILMGNGDEIIQGTPFDLQIRRYIEDNDAEASQQKVPLVIVLRGSKGRLVAHGESHPPWPVELPPFPKEPERPTETADQAAGSVRQPDDLSRTLVTTNKGPIVYAEPLIVSGKKSGSTPTEGSRSNVNAAELTNASEHVVSNSAINHVTNTGASAKPFAAEAIANDDTTDSQSQPIVEASQADETSTEVGTGFWSPVKLAAFGALCLVVVVGALMLRPRSRASGHTSLITRSMDKKRPRPKKGH